MLNVITIIYIYKFIYVSLQKNNMARIKTKVFQLRASEEFMAILKALSEKKGMSQANLIEHLIRKEYDTLQIKEKYESKEQQKKEV